MPNEEVRALERRWRETGATEDEVVYLRARLGAYELDPETLALAAFCGHPAAVAIESTGEETLAAWVALGASSVAGSAASAAPTWGLGRWGRAALLRAIAAVIRRVLPREGLDPRLAGVAHAFERWLLYGGDGAEIEDAEQRLEAVAAEAAGQQESLAIALLRRACKCSWYPVHEAALEAAALAAAQLGADEVEATIAGELVPWALHERDPVRERAATAGSGRHAAAEQTPADDAASRATG